MGHSRAVQTLDYTYASAERAVAKLDQLGEKSEKRCNDIERFLLEVSTTRT
jgi:hypothetical protein